MSLERRNLDGISPKRFDHGLDLVAYDHEVASNGSLTSASRLKVDRVRRAHCRRHRHAAFGDWIAPWHVELVDTTVDRAFGADDLVELRRVEVNGWGRDRRCSGWIERSFAQRQGRSNDFSHFDGIAMAADMHVEGFRIRAQQVIVNRRDLVCRLLLEKKKENEADVLIDEGLVVWV